MVGKKAQNIGIKELGQQAANFAIRSFDLVIFVGCHFSATQAGNNYTNISKSQEFVHINIDEEELKDLFVKKKHTKLLLDSNYFFQKIIEFNLSRSLGHLNWPNFLEELSEELSPKKCVSKLNIENYANPHKFINDLYSNLKKEDIVVIDGGGCSLCWISMPQKCRIY